jgi:hypothetical protein
MARRPLVRLRALQRHMKVVGPTPCLRGKASESLVVPLWTFAPSHESSQSELRLSSRGTTLQDFE